MYYVIGSDSFSSWLLTTTPASRAEAQRAIDWQLKSRDRPADYFVVVIFEKARNAFVAVNDPREFRPDRGPYTAEAWARICREIGYNPFPRHVETTARAAYWEMAPGRYQAFAPGTPSPRDNGAGYADLVALKKLKGD